MIDFSFALTARFGSEADFTCNEKTIDASGIEAAFVGRLTNFDQIAQSLGLSRDVTIGAFLCAAWRKWGDGLADQLRGNFLIAVYDNRARQLYVARDAMGVMPVYYSRFDKSLVVSNSSGAVRARLPHAPALNRAQLADFLCGEESGYESTFFDDIARLPPGHWLKCCEGGLSKKRYWNLHEVRSIGGTLSEQTERFQEIFDKSLATTYVEGKTAILMSGGLDSSMIAGSLMHVMKAGPEVLALSRTYPNERKWNDRPHIESLRNYLPFSFAELPGDGYDPLLGLDLHLRALDGPYISYGHSETFAGKAFLADAGFSGVLNGHGGDEIVSYGAGRLNELALERKWLELWRQTEPLSRLHNTSRWQLFSPYLSHFYRIRLLRQYWSRLAQQASPEPKTYPILTDEGKQLVQGGSGQLRNPLSRRYDHTERSLHEEDVTSALYARAFEVMAIASAAVGVETLMPFCDRDLVEYSTSLPSETKLGGGFTRRILREAMRGRVPETVRTRSDKYDFTRPFIAGLLSVKSRMDELIDAHRGILAELVDRKELQRLRSEVIRCGNDIDRQDARCIWRILVASKWIEIVKSEASSQI